MKKYSVEEIKGNSISQLIEKGMLPKNGNQTYLMPTGQFEIMLQNSTDFIDTVASFTSKPLKGGTEKQIKWAESIRLEKACELAYRIVELNYNIQVGLLPGNAIDEISSLSEKVEYFKNNDSAIAYIDKRYDNE